MYETEDNPWLTSEYSCTGNVVVDGYDNYLGCFSAIDSCLVVVNNLTGELAGLFQPSVYPSQMTMLDSTPILFTNQNGLINIYTMPELTATATSDDVMAPAKLSIGNYPNPFNPETTIRFALPASGLVKLSVYNVRGQKVRTLVNDTCPQGVQSVVFNGRDDACNTLASGVYLYRLEAAGKSITNKMLLVK